MIIWLSTYIITNLTDLKSEKLYGVFNDQKERCQMALWIKTYFGRYSWLNKNTTPCTPKNGFWYSLDVILKFSNMFPCHSNAGIFLTYWIMGVWDRKSQEKDCWRGAFVSHIDASVFRGQVVEFIIKDKREYKNFCHFCKLFQSKFEIFYWTKLGALTNLIDR